MAALAAEAAQMAFESEAISKRTKEVPSKIINSDAEQTDLRRLGTDFNYKFESRPYSFHIAIALTHVSALFGLYYCFTRAKLLTVIWGALMTVVNIQAVVLGAHRAFSHHSFKPSKSLKFALIFFHTMAGQHTIHWWVRDHRVHHKYTDTDADPYNSSRGFFFSHMRWYLVKKHPLVMEKSKQIDISDILSDKWLMFQKKYYWTLHVIVGLILPVSLPMYLWNETFESAYHIAFSLRMIIILHAISSINSFAHMFGSRPFDERIRPVQSKLVHWLTGGDGWHNFHHCFPWDYGLGEYGYGKGLSTLAIEFFAKYGFATDLKKASMRVVEGHSHRHGDGSLNSTNH